MKPQKIYYQHMEWPAGSMWAGAQSSPQETQNQRRQSRNGRHCTHAGKKPWSFCISASPRSSSRIWRELQPPHWTCPDTENWRSLLKPGASLQPQGWASPSLFWFLTSEGWGDFQNFPQRWHFSCKATGEKLAWLHPTNGSHFGGGLEQC